MTPEAGAPACHRCKGRSIIQQEAATESVFTPDINEFMETFAAYHTHGIMPLGPNRQDQPATWLEAATFMEAALADYRETERKQAEDRRASKKPKAPR